jgi:hypothetical protein
MNGTTHVGESAIQMTVPKCGRGEDTAELNVGILK